MINHRKRTATRIESKGGEFFFEKKKGISFNGTAQGDYERSDPPGLLTLDDDNDDDDDAWFNYKIVYLFNMTIVRIMISRRNWRALWDIDDLVLDMTGQCNFIFLYFFYFLIFN